MITNLFDDILNAANVTPDRRFPTWIKRVDKIDSQYQDGYIFRGDFINKGTIEIDPNVPAVYLVCTTQGSVKHHTAYYSVVVRENGQLRLTDIKTDGFEKGWALRMRDPIAALLQTGDAPPDEMRFSMPTVEAGEANRYVRIVNANTGAEVKFPVESFEQLILMPKSMFDDLLSLIITIRESEEVESKR